MCTSFVSHVRVDFSMQTYSPAPQKRLHPLQNSALIQSKSKDCRKQLKCIAAVLCSINSSSQDTECDTNCNQCICRVHGTVAIDIGSSILSADKTKTHTHYRYRIGCRNSAIAVNVPPESIKCGYGQITGYYAKILYLKPFLHPINTFFAFRAFNVPESFA